MQETSLHNSTFKLLALIIGLNLAFSVPGLWVPYYNIDEVTNSLFGKLISQSRLELPHFIGSPYFLTHYLYVAVERLFEPASLALIHVLFALWKSGTIVAVYASGKELAGRQAGVAAAFFYMTASFSFMSKDFHTPSAEAFSILPAVLAFFCLFRNMKRPSIKLVAAAGALEALAALFKMPMGIITVSTLGLLLYSGKERFKPALVFIAAFCVTFFLPALLLAPAGQGIKLFFDHLHNANAAYIQTYSASTSLYVVVKFILRSALIAISMFTVSFFSAFAIGQAGRKADSTRKGVLFLASVFVFLWVTVLLGKRIFYHYYVFWLAVLPLLAGVGYVKAREWLAGRPKSWGTMVFFFVSYAIPLALHPDVGFGIEGAFNLSTRPPNVREVTEHVRATTRPQDRIYVWGQVPQIYLFSGRMPATTMFWSDLLAGASPGSPAMEYMRATGDTLSLGENIVKDLLPDPYEVHPDAPSKGLTAISDSELFHVDELLERINNPHWKKVFEDFFREPPVLFIDSSPSNIRGFGHYPVGDYELLERFVQDNYILETQKNRMLIYRLKKN